MKERPILFSAPMVRAILAGTKTQTRRVAKGVAALHLITGEPLARCDSAGPRVRCPYGQPGDRIWGKETFFAFGRWETRFSEKKGRDEWHFVDMTLECGHRYHYAVADDTLIVGAKGRGGATPMWWKRPAIFMPRVASRITLEVTDVKVERLGDISEEDALAEGIIRQSTTGWFSVPGLNGAGTTARAGYALLWNSINGPGSWDANPWVWCVSFKRLEAA